MKPLGSFLAILAPLLWTAAAGADPVTLNDTYPSRYGNHANTTSSGDTRIENPYGANVSSVFYGDMTVNDDALFTNSEVIVAQGRGPYGDDGLRVRTNGLVSIGNNNGAIASLLTVHTRIKSRNFYAWENDASIGDIVYTYGEAEYNPIPPGDTGKSARFGARRTNGTWTNLADDTYIPLRIEGYEVNLGIFDASAPPNLNDLGYVQWVGIGMDRDQNNVVQWPSDPLPVNFPLLEVNGNATITGTGDSYSSRAFKKDIEPLTPSDYAAFLEKAKRTPVYHYRFKTDPAGTPHVGVMAEEAPEEIIVNGKGLSLTDAAAFLTACVKELKTRNDALRRRIEVLEAAKRGEAAHAAR